MEFETVVAVEVEPREKTKVVRLRVSNIRDRLFVADDEGNEIWISTVYGQIQVGVIGGEKYSLVAGRLMSETDEATKVNPIGRKLKAVEAAELGPVEAERQGAYDDG